MKRKPKPVPIERGAAIQPTATDCTVRLEYEGSADRTPERFKADLMIQGVALDSHLATIFSNGALGPVSLTDAFHSLIETTAAVKAGDLAIADSLLVAQAVALNVMFVELARRGSGYMGSSPVIMETYLRLGLKCQAQSRATLETLANIKNPTTVFARQANINNGGQQQVNNALAPSPASAPARTGKAKAAPNKLLEDPHGQRLDTRATRAAGGTDSNLAPLGKGDRPAHGRRKGTRGAQR